MTRDFEPEPSSSGPPDAGVLLTTEVEMVDLGVHHGVRLEGEVQRRTLRLGIGGRRGLRFELARLRPTSVRSTSATGVMVHRLPPVADPWLAAAQRLAVLTIASVVVPWLFRRSRIAQRAAR